MHIGWNVTLLSSICCTRKIYTEICYKLYCPGWPGIPPSHVLRYDALPRDRGRVSIGPKHPNASCVSRGIRKILNEKIELGLSMIRATWPGSNFFASRFIYFNEIICLVPFHFTMSTRGPDFETSKILSDT